ncbi:Hercynine oxygenase [Candidatus Entotheonellaceae bacterium PAL068K]
MVTPYCKKMMPRFPILVVILSVFLLSSTCQHNINIEDLDLEKLLKESKAWRSEAEAWRSEANKLLSRTNDFNKTLKDCLREVEKIDIDRIINHLEKIIKEGTKDLDKITEKRLKEFLNGLNELSKFIDEITEKRLKELLEGLKSQNETLRGILNSIIDKIDKMVKNWLRDLFDRAEDFLIGAVRHIVQQILLVFGAILIVLLLFHPIRAELLRKPDPAPPWQMFLASIRAVAEIVVRWFPAAVVLVILLFSLNWILLGPPQHRLTVHSTPDGASVYINEQGYGSTRVDVDLRPGDYTVRVEKAGYRTYTEAMTLDAPRVVRATLQPVNCWHQRSKGQVCQEPMTGMTFVWIPGGCVQMGSTASEAHNDEQPVGEVCVDGFWMGQHEVTVGAFRQFVQANNYRPDEECWSFIEEIENRSWQDGRFPVSCVSWGDAQQFIAWLPQQSGQGFRLPTEAEWEYAARGGTRTERFWGQDSATACRYANVADWTLKGTLKGSIEWMSFHACNDGYAFAAPVGRYRPNPFGLYDMLGNVWEWVSDWYDDDYYARRPRRNPRGPSGGSSRVDRGGGWGSRPAYVRSAYRDRAHPAARYAPLGFRLSRTDP